MSGVNAADRGIPGEGARPIGGGAGSLFLLAAVFCSGAAVMVVEMTAVRILTPWFGSTNYVWTNVIAVVLAALSVGYAVGGRLADRRPVPGLLYGFMASGGLLVALGAVCATSVAQWLLPVGLDLEGAQSILSKGSLGATLILFAPATLLLGMVSPLAIRLLCDQGVGRAAGRVFAVGTTGSIIGTYLPTLYLVPHFGSRGSMYFAAGLLVTPAVIGLVLFARQRGAAAAAVCVTLAGVTTAFADTRPGRDVPELRRDGTATLLHEEESPYQYLTVRDDVYPDGTTERLLTINEGVYTYHSFKVRGKVLTASRYYDDYALLPFLLDIPAGEPLEGAVVGMACGVNAQQWKHFWDGPYRLHVTGAELDPSIVEIGRRWFDLPQAPQPWLDVHVMDGRQMLEVLPEDRRFDMLVVDAFTNELYIPFHLGTREFFELCRRRMRLGGVLAMNVYAIGGDAPNLLALQNTLATVFGHAVRVSQFWGTNFVLLARNGVEPPDLTRLSPARIRRIWGDREAVPEWGDLVDAAGWVVGHGQVVRPDPAARVLTDDRAPLEWLTDRFLDRLEGEILGR